MAEFRGKVVTDEDLKKFRQRISQYEWHQLGLFDEYFLEDLIYIIESLDAQCILRELSSRKIASVEYYQSIKKQCGASVFAEMLVEDIHVSGRDAVLGFWESLYVLQNDHPHPNLLGALDELTQTDKLEQSILLDKQGPELHERLQACQLQHKQYLQEKTQNLVEHRAPGLTNKSQSFHISERYLDLIVVSSNHFRTHSQHELIATGGIHEHYLQRAQSNLERISPNRLFRWCHRKRSVPKTVLVSGVPGVGKTTLMQKFVYDWANGNLYQRFAFVFFFKFRDLNTMGKTSLAQMILSEYPYLRGDLEQIFLNPKNLLFIFDGLDESKNQVDFKSSHLCNDPQSSGDSSIIVVSLVKQTLLEGCSVLITSRPTRVAEIDVDIFHRMSQIVGFFPKQREMYFQHFFKNTLAAEKAFHYVRENGILYTFCYIPAYCWIICTVLEMSFKTQGSNDPTGFLFPKTVTQLFVAFVSNILTNHNQDVSHAKKALTELGLLAEYGLSNQALVFEEEDVQPYITNTNSHMVSSFIVESGQPPRLSYSFFHLTVQEFLAALLHYLDCSSEKLKETLTNTRSFEDGRREIFLRFISGLSDNSTRSLLKPFVGTLSAQASKDVISFLQESVTQAWNPDRQDADKRKILNVFACLAESRNKGLVSSSIGSNQEFDFVDFYLAPLDCTVLAFILESCGETELLDLSSCFIQSEGLERLAPALHNIAVLNLTNNNLRDEDMRYIHSILTNPQCRIRTLSLMNNGLTEESCLTLANAINENKSLRELDLSKNKLAGKNSFLQLLAVLSEPTCRIECLELQEIKLTPEYAAFLLSLTNNPNLTDLNISCNFFSDTGYPHIQQLILEHPSLKQIRVGMNSFSDKTENKLQQLQRQRPGVKIIM
ncbi:hypothetical protein XENTR_v10022638 [Xenopus tropicalis]|uniref:NACHT, LRR and PYD domains-containing protein 14 n=1 Tax=Xenopus tropicalis TaxID=8364 RepID=A0A6I8RNW0_XENTR|nr:NACHT, LRR and PYD domains-containing protein 14 isoform X1 [Xenopus tropicalis]KAE8588609.1 hypothetical protein XENTR_v10022638 [Xenopus tropicalis]KAE8588610.1 hypothetical protein XENTR_v10022638 [Xenopus tropicalis]|eukprot:XP_002944439.2 PREDICTED: NACHT, LRR and PYD domains-containing protein 12-like isoform X1 [Xenopus tropicalis]